VAQFKARSQCFPEGTEEITINLGTSKDDLKCKDFPLVQNLFFPFLVRLLSETRKKPLERDTHICFSSV